MPVSYYLSGNSPFVRHFFSDFDEIWNTNIVINYFTTLADTFIRSYKRTRVTFIASSVTGFNWLLRCVQHQTKSSFRTRGQFFYSDTIFYLIRTGGFKILIMIQWLLTGRTEALPMMLTWSYVSRACPDVSSRGGVPTKVHCVSGSGAFSLLQWSQWIVKKKKKRFWKRPFKV